MTETAHQQSLDGILLNIWNDLTNDRKYYLLNLLDIKGLIEQHVYRFKRAKLGDGNYISLCVLSVFVRHDRRLRGKLFIILVAWPIQFTILFNRYTTRVMNTPTHMLQIEIACT